MLRLRKSFLILIQAAETARGGAWTEPDKKVQPWRSEECGVYIYRESMNGVKRQKDRQRDGSSWGECWAAVRSGTGFSAPCCSSGCLRRVCGGNSVRWTSLLVHFFIYFSGGFCCHPSRHLDPSQEGLRWSAASWVITFSILFIFSLWSINKNHFIKVKNMTSYGNVTQCCPSQCFIKMPPWTFVRGQTTVWSLIF